MKGHKIFKKLTDIKTRKFFLFVYDQGTKELFAETTKFYNEYKKLFTQYKDMLADHILLDIYNEICIDTRRKYSEFSRIFNVKPKKEFESLDFVVDELLNRNAMAILLENLDIFDKDTIAKIAHKVTSSNDFNRMLTMLNLDNIPNDLREELEYALISTKNYNDICRYAINSKHICNFKYLMEILFESDSNYSRSACELAQKYYNHPDFNIKQFAKYLIKNNEIEYLEDFYYFLDKEDEFLDCLLEVSNAWQLSEFAIVNQERLSWKEIDKIEKKLMSCNEPKALFKFLSDVAEANLFNIQKVFIEKGYCKYMYQLAKMFTAADTKLLRKEIYKREDLLYMYKFDSDINNYIRYDVIRKILKSKDPKLLYSFSNICPKEYVKDCEEKLKEFEDDTYLRFFYESHRR